LLALDSLLYRRVYAAASDGGCGPD
jgi:hypothetical protein